MTVHKMANLLADLQTLQKTPGQTKKAEASQPNPTNDKVAAAYKEMLAAAQKLTADSGVSKTAAQPDDAAQQILKLAADMANVEEAAQMKLAQLLGAAVADGFVARLNQHGAVSQSEKTASDDEIKLAMEQGYNDGLAYIEQMRHAAAQQPDQEKIASFQQGYADTVAQIQQMAATPDGQEKIASFQQGYADTVAQIQQMAATPDGQEKLAAIQQGYVDTMAQAEKLASDCVARGYNDTIKVLSKLPR